MPDQEEVEGQFELLAAFRRTLSQYLRQQAQLGEAYAPPPVLAGIYEARQNIRRVKGIMRSWGVNVDDHPNDEDVGQILQLALIQADGTQTSDPSPADIAYVLDALDSREGAKGSYLRALA